MAVLAILLGSVSIIEATTRVNLLELVWGERPEEGASTAASRWGLKRAYGNCMHPIYFGGLLIMLLGPTGFMSQLALARRANALWIFAPIPVLLGIFCTGSRGPILCIGILIIATTFVLRPKLRKPIFALIGLGLICAILLRDPIIKSLEHWSGEDRSRTTYVVIDDETKQYTGTRNRLLLIEAYSIALRRSGIFGFGTQATSGFPVNVPFGPREVATMNRIRFIDNEYILLALRFGILGCSLFICIAASSLTQLYRTYESQPHTRRALYSASLFGSLWGVLSLILTVWMPHEIGFPLIWIAGSSSGLYLFSTTIRY